MTQSSSCCSRPHTSALEAGGGTDLYSGLIRALQEVQKYDAAGTLNNYLPAIVAMTDGQSDTGHRDDFINLLRSERFGKDIPIHAVSFGSDVDTDQLQQLTDLTVGKLFNGDNLVDTLREVKGYN